MLESLRAFFVMLRECVAMSLSNIASNRVRSFLTVLGILIGVSAVIALITTVSGVSGSLSSSFSAMGAGTLMVSVSGSNAYYFRANPDLVKRGRALNVIDERNRSGVCWISPDMVETFFYGVGPLGRTLYIDGIPFTVAGLQGENADQSVASMLSGSPDILIPYTTALKMNNANVVTSLTAYLAPGVDSEAASDTLEAELDALFSFEEDTFTITTMSGIEDTMQSMLGMMTALLAGIASIALVVGGIGIMNMMLTTVTERTAEIGLKKALGALPWQIQVQFPIESFLLSMIGGATLADTFSSSGSVTSAATSEVYAAIGGRVARVAVKAGDSVKAGDVIATLETEKVYAAESGTVTGVFGQPGDNAETIGQRYGAVLYIESESVYSITASTDEAYSTTANKLVHVGEEVILSAYSDSSRRGSGVITSIEGVNHNVRVLSGSFLVGEKITVYRGSAVSSKRIGRGTLDRTSPTAVTAQGSIVSIAVKDGDSVHKGDLLFGTLSGDFDGLYMTGCDVLATVDGVVSQVNAQQGAMLEKNSVAAVLFPADAMQITAKVDEEDLRGIAVGDPVSIELIWNQDEDAVTPGTVSAISAIASDAIPLRVGLSVDVEIGF